MISLTYGIELINGIALLPVFPFTNISAYCLFPAILKTTSFIFNFKSSCGLQDESLEIA